jgi:isochorismate synthase
VKPEPVEHVDAREFVSRPELSTSAVADGEPARDRILDTHLRAALAIAGRGTGMTFIASRAPVLPVPQVVDAGGDATVVAWSANELTVVGIGVAVELRGTGSDRWAAVVEAARSLRINGAIVDRQPRAFRRDGGSNGARARASHIDVEITNAAVANASRIDGDVATVAACDLQLVSVNALGSLRPRFFGGAAFAPGAADRAPWVGFGDAWFVLPRWTYVREGDGAWFVLAVDELEAREASRWSSELAMLRAALDRGWVAEQQPAIVELDRAPATRWHTQVRAITDSIARGECSKIVAARTCSVSLAGSIRPADLLSELDARHADCVRVLVRPPGAGTLVAATPERLVRRDGGVILCDALAGTVRHDGRPGEAAATLLASAKDRREHDLVVRAIRAALEDTGAVVEAPSEPAIRTLRHVLHLHTPFRATSGSPLHVLELVARLHPTPAVGGTPTDVAVDWIQVHEPVARGWYASPIGWFDLEGDGELAVAIRSGLLVGARAHLWAGAGIVAGSDPDRELAETELKLRAMLGALGTAAEPMPVAVASGGNR